MTAQLRRPFGRTEPAGQHPAHSPVVVISLDPESSGEWTSSLRGAGFRHLFTRAWGDTVAYRTLLGAPRSLAVLDLPDRYPSSSLLDHIRSLRLIAPVAVTVAGGRPVDELLDAGAVDALPRHAPPSEICARLRADLRWLAGHRAGPAEGRHLPGPTRRLRGRIGSKGSQDFLLDLLTLGARTGEVVCCHDLGRLLGPPGRPLSPRALRARMDRLDPLLAATGRRLDRTRQWGRDFFRVEPGPRPESAPTPWGSLCFPEAHGTSAEAFLTGGRLP